MDSSGDEVPASNFCPCSCQFCSQSSPYNKWHRSVKRKAEAPSPEDSSSATYSGVAYVEIDSEVTVLRETISHQMEVIRELGLELDEERNAASSAANEAMAMILRLQREKADAVLEARQFKRFAEEKMRHDDDELGDLEDLLMKRDEMVRDLEGKVYEYKVKLKRLGFREDSDEMEFEYPPLKCSVPVSVPLKSEEELEISSFGENPSEDLSNLEQRIFKLEKQENQENQEKLKDEDFNNDDDSDDSSDRIYMVDTVYGPSDTPKIRVSDEKDVDIKKLYLRLEALEADRESMRQALMSMRTEKTQLVLLQEIAQQLSKEVVGNKERREVEKKEKKKKSFVECFSILTLFKWLFSLVFKTPRIRYTFGLSTRNAGLLVILEKTPLMSRLRCSNIKGNRINMK